MDTALTLLFSNYAVQGILLGVLAAQDLRRRAIQPVYPLLMVLVGVPLNIAVLLHTGAAAVEGWLWLLQVALISTVALVFGRLGAWGSGDTLILAALAAAEPPITPVNAYSTLLYTLVFLVAATLCNVTLNLVRGAPTKPIPRILSQRYTSRGWVRLSLPLAPLILAGYLTAAAVWL